LGQGGIRPGFKEKRPLPFTGGKAVGKNQTVNGRKKETEKKNGVENCQGRHTGAETRKGGKTKKNNDIKKKISTLKKSWEGQACERQSGVSPRS